MTSDNTRPMTVGEWRARAPQFEVGSHTVQLAALRKQPGYHDLAATLDKLRAWAGPWGALACETARWLAVTPFARDKASMDQINRHLGTLQRAGCYPGNVQSRDSREQQTADRNVALAAYRRWADAGSRIPPMALYLVQMTFREEVEVAHMNVCDQLDEGAATGRLK